MSSLLLSTLIMMGLTFAIGFFVAAVIKIIANWADLLEFYHSHQTELVAVKRARRQDEAVSSATLPLVHGEAHRKLVHRINEAISNFKARKRVTA